MYSEQLMDTFFWLAAPSVAMAVAQHFQQYVAGQFHTFGMDHVVMHAMPS